MTLGVLRTRVQERLAAISGTPWTTLQINAALNDGQSLFAFLTLCIERETERRLPADRHLWLMRDEVPDWIAPLRVKCRHAVSIDGYLFDEAEFDTQLINDPTLVQYAVSRVRPATLADLDAISPRWQAERSGVVKRYGCQGADVFFIHPCPADSLTWLASTYAAEPQLMSDDSHEAEIPAEDHPALVSYALAMLPMPFGGSELARFAPDFDFFLKAAARRAEAVRVRSLAHRYDTLPAEIKLHDRSRGAVEKAKT